MLLSVVGGSIALACAAGYGVYSYAFRKGPAQNTNPSLQVVSSLEIYEFFISPLTFVYVQETMTEEPGNEEPKKSDTTSEVIKVSQVCIILLLETFEIECQVFLNRAKPRTNKACCVKRNVELFSVSILYSLKEMIQPMFVEYN